jgi:GNAT superfamily N-acetyltransferase
MRANAERVTLRAMVLEDIVEGVRLSGLAGWNQREEDWHFLLERNRGRFVVALRDGRVVGTGGAVCYGTTLAWVCMILVDTEQRGHGIGALIVEGVLKHLTDISTIGLDATPYGQSLYARLGFVETSRLLRMERSGKAPQEVASSAPPSREAHPMRPSDLDRVLAYDREVFGADRAELLRWAAQRAPALWVEGDGGAIAGYCFGRNGARSRQIGPVVAREAATARALVGAALGAGAGEHVVLDVPADRSDWLAILAEMGFREQRPLIRMYRAARPPGRPDLQLAIFGPEFG